MSFSAKLLEKNVNSNIVKKAREYISRVQITNVTSGIVRGKVQGSSLYDSVIQRNPNGSYTDLCSCPYGATCKHTLALAYLVEKNPDFLAKLEEKINIQEIFAMIQNQSPWSVLPNENKEDKAEADEKNTFLQKLKKINRVEDEIFNNLQHVSQNQDNVQLYYVLSPVEVSKYYNPYAYIDMHEEDEEEDENELSRYLTVSAGKIRFSKNGSIQNFNKPKSIEQIIDEYGMEVRQKDKQILQAIQYSQSLKDYKIPYYDVLPNNAVEEILTELSKTAYLSWEDNKKTKPIKVFPRTTNTGLRFKLVKKDSNYNLEKYLVFKHKEEKITTQITVFNYQPPIIKVRGSLYILNNHIDTEKLQKLVRIDQIPEEIMKDEQALKEILKVCTNVDLRLPDNFVDTKQKLKPAPVLNIDQSNTPWEVKLQIKYPNKTINPFKEKSKYYQTKEKEIKKIYERNTLAETKFIQTFTELFPMDQVTKSHLVKQSEQQTFLHEKLPNLPEDWQIKIKGEKNYVGRISESDYEFEINSGIDWLDINGKINYKDSSVKLSQVIDEIMSDKSLINLDGQTVILSKDLKQKLNSLLPHYNDKKQNFSLHKSQIGSLDKIKGIVQDSDLHEEWVQTLESLKNFKKVHKARIPSTLQAKLRPYQVDGVSWLNFLKQYQFGGILADDMGLGKTLQTLALLVKVYARTKFPKKSSLIIAPTSIVHNWKLEIERFAPSLKYHVYIDKKRTLPTKKKDNPHIILTSYPILTRDHELLKQKEFLYCILDEAHYIKNHKSKTSQATKSLKAEHRICLTGTPIENNLLELWSQFAFINPHVLGNLQTFKTRFFNPIVKNADENAQEHLRALIKPFLLRRLKEDVVKDLPKKNEQLIWCEMSDNQRKFYDAFKTYYQHKVYELVETKGIHNSQIEILEALLRLRQAVCHPKLLKLEESKKFTSLPKNILKIEQSVKLETTLELLKSAIESEKKTLVFSQFASMIKILETELKAAGIDPIILTGQSKNRGELVERFQNTDVHKIFLISLKAGGTGLNLTAASNVIHYDPWWNPAVEAQATDRAHRIGQDKTVSVYKMLVKDSIEEKILTLQEKKKGLVQNILNGTSQGKGLTKDDLQFLFA